MGNHSRLKLRVINISLNILLVHPKDKFELFSRKSVPPLWAAVLASLTPEQHNIDQISCAFEDITEAKVDGYDLVGISATTTVADSAYKIADMCRARGIKVVLGGLHASMLPQEAAAHVDSIVHGEAEYIWSTVLNDAENDDLKLHYQGPLAEDKDIAIPDYSSK